MFKNRILKNIILSTIIGVTGFASVYADSVKLKSNRDYIVTVTRPGNLVLVDAKEQKIVNNCRIKEAFSPGGVVLAPNNKHAFVLGGFGEEIGGYNITTCERIFHAKLSQGNIKGQSLAGISVSEDSEKVYAIYNRTQMNSDEYKVLDPMFSQFNVKDGIDAKAEISFNIPRQMTLMSVAKDGTIFGIGSALYTIDPESKSVKVVKKILGWGKENYSDPDSAGNYIIGQQQGDFSTLYYAEKYDKEGTDIGWYWGITSVDLETKKVEQFEFTDYETLMFTIMRDPTNRNIAFGSLNDLTKFDLKNKKVLKRVVLPHTYYSVAIAPNGKNIYLGSCLNDIAIYNPNTLELLGHVSLPGDMGSAALQVFHNN